MARTAKVGLDYFSHDVDMLQDQKIKILKAKHGLIGYAIFLRLLEEVYRVDGYYLKINDDFNILFCDDNNIAIDVYINVLNECINKDLFDINLYNDYSILTSKRIQLNYLMGCERRTEVHLIQQYILLEKDNVLINKINVYINSLNVDIGTQSKVNKIKQNKIKNNNKEKQVFLVDDYLKSYNYSQVLNDIILEFTEHRKSIKKPLTEISLKKTLQQLEMWNYSEEQKVQCLSNSIMNGWQGIFELNNKTLVTTKPQPQTGTAATNYLDKILQEEYEKERENGQSGNWEDCILVD